MIWKYISNKNIVNTSGIANDSDLISALESKLQKKGFRTSSSSSKIIFKRIIYTSTHSGQNKLEHLKIIRNGIVTIKHLNEKTNIQITVDLLPLLFFSIFLGWVIGAIRFFVLDINALGFIIASIISSSLIYLIGYLIVKTEMEDVL